MKKIIVCLFLMLALACPAQAELREVQDSVPIDKWAHFFMGAWIGDFARDGGYEWWQAALFVYGIGVLKEVADENAGGTFEQSDILSGCLGVGFTFTLDEIFQK